MTGSHAPVSGTRAGRRPPRLLPLAVTAGSAASAAAAVAAADAQPDAVSIDGGASAIRIRSLSVSGSEARVVAEVDDWAAMAQRSPAGGWNVAVPENTIDAEAGLVRAADGRWVVSDLEWSFHPGSEP